MIVPLCALLTGNLYLQKKKKVSIFVADIAMSFSGMHILNLTRLFSVGGGNK